MTGDAGWSNEENSDELDLGDLGDIQEAKKEPISTEETRRLSLLLLTGLIALVLVIGYIMGLGIIGCPAAEGKCPTKWDEAREFIEITFVPLIALLSGLLGYYANH